MPEHRFLYPARFEPGDDSDVLVVSFRDVPQAITQGDDLADTRWQAADCLAEAAAAYLVMGRDLPPPTRARRGEILVPLDAVIAAKTALASALRESGLTKAAFARRLGVDVKEVRRMLDPRHATKIPALARALAALDKQIVIEVHDAA